MLLEDPRRAACIRPSGANRSSPASRVQEEKEHTDTINPRFLRNYGKIWEVGGRHKPRQYGNFAWRRTQPYAVVSNAV
eukprot:7097716-Pyramimonas_sp.AAC.1